MRVNKPWIAGVGLFLLTLVVYLPSTQNGYIWDDDDLLTKNPVVLSEEGLRKIWTELGATGQYYPMVFSSFWLEFRLWELRPLGYHLDNMILHATSVILLWLVLRSLGLPGAGLAACVWGIHPVNVESVAWVSERKNVLSGCFYLAALYSYLQFVRWEDFLPGNEKGASRPVLTSVREWFWYGLALVLFACALLSKTVTSTLPAVILVIIWWKRNAIRGEDVYPMVPLFLASLFMGLLTLWMEKHFVGAGGEEWNYTGYERGLIAGRALWVYGAHLVWPFQLSFFYWKWPVNGNEGWPYGFSLGVLFAGAALWVFRERIGRGPLAAVLIFCGTLFPALGFVDVYPMRYSFVADHFQYLAGASLIAGVVAWGVCSGLDTNSRARMSLVIFLISVLGGLTWHRQAAFRDLDTLWRDTIAKNPRGWVAYSNLGGIVGNRGDHRKAEILFSKALSLYPKDYVSLTNWGNGLAQEGKTAEALARYDEALKINPRFSVALCNKADLLFRQGKYSLAESLYVKALQSRLSSLQARLGFGNVLAQKKKWGLAIAQYREVLNGDPKNTAAHINLAGALVELEKFDEAALHYGEAVRWNPKDADAHFNLAQLLVRQGKLAEAAGHFSVTLRLHPDDSEARENLRQIQAALAQRTPPQR